MPAERTPEDMAREILYLDASTTKGEWQDYFEESGRGGLFTHAEEGTKKLFTVLKASGPADAGFVCVARNFGPDLARAYLAALEETTALKDFIEEINEMEVYEKWLDS